MIPDMGDPKPENITGEKIQQHNFNHNIDWHYLVLGLAIIYLAYTVNKHLDSDSSDEEDSDSSVEDLDVEAVHDATGLTAN